MNSAPLPIPELLPPMPLAQLAPPRAVAAAAVAGFALLAVLGVWRGAPANGMIAMPPPQVHVAAPVTPTPSPPIIEAAAQAQPAALAADARLAAGELGAPQ